MSRAVFVEDLWWKYVGRSDYALRGVDLEVERGEFFAIMGHTGAGKTTLVLALTGIIPQRVPGEFRGRVEVLGMSTLSRDVSEITKRVAVVFEDPEIQFVMSTVEDELVLSLEPLGLSREEIRERLEWSLELVGL
ncbi:MAG: ABC transporter ATP-binding protein, partial [Thermofilaceae archaeon]